ncbi:hypothetical protein TD95_002172 [Thielaviopsis punctulata]|uniref:CN hydrolase domain-containing protein n=1 Tax=Thielaviopsis punctulata TaxID=72032 RepID=A0A0F4Z638_9PEZI|nr:hypothetical protein TD95_002172 [Thielaviopsis punctulata]
MRIGCLQFAPEKGDLNHNLSRADSVLLKANPKNLDLLVLPELAFCGHGFNSLNDIYPFLEPSASGITSLWARTTALKYNCSVVVGYAEKVDVRHKWPSDPEYYNSVIAINSEGETVANYRKCQLQPSDETWALEGPDGFHQDWISELGEVSIGISMDINPYRFQDSWDSFDFALHIMEVAVNIVIVAMAWPSIENSREYSQVPSEPDTDTLMYWISRLEPVIRAENEEEVIIIFCNRCGSQGSTCYTGTSTVLGISNGEVRVYGLLGRGTKELLVVDTSNPPYGRLVYRPSADVAREQEVQAYAFMNRESIASSHVSRLSAKAADARESQPSPYQH